MKSSHKGRTWVALPAPGPGLTGWREWLVARRGRECNHAWTGPVRHIALPEESRDHWQLSPEQEERVVTTLFALLDDFFAEREAGAHTP